MMAPDKLERLFTLVCYFVIGFNCGIVVWDLTITTKWRNLAKMAIEDIGKLTDLLGNKVANEIAEHSARRRPQPFN